MLITSAAIFGSEDLLVVRSPVIKSLLLFALNVVLALGIFNLLDRGVIIGGAGSHRRDLMARAARAGAQL